jgi:hypothetical protein
MPGMPQKITTALIVWLLYRIEFKPKTPDELSVSRAEGEK